MKKSHNLAKILAKYGDQELWVALSEDRKKVVGKGVTLKEALDEARRNNAENPSVIKALPDYSNFILCLSSNT